MFYSFIRGIVFALIYLINGVPKSYNKEQLPKGNYVLVAPHRTWFDPVLYAMVASPKKFAFMAKQELFKNKFLSWLITSLNAFPVDRNHPGPSAIKTPVKLLKNSDLSTIIFPSGTRHSEELKSGAFVIAKLAGVPLVPAVYQGPLTFKSLFSRRKIKIAFGKPIQVDKKMRMNEGNLTILESQLNAEFASLDQEIDPSFKYVDVSSKK